MESFSDEVEEVSEVGDFYDSSEVLNVRKLNSKRVGGVFARIFQDVRAGWSVSSDSLGDWSLEDALYVHDDDLDGDLLRVAAELGSVVVNFGEIEVGLSAEYVDRTYYYAGSLAISVRFQNGRIASNMISTGMKKGVVRVQGWEFPGDGLVAEEQKFIEKLSLRKILAKI